MADCPYCHKNAGMLKKEHEECRVADQEIADAVGDAVHNGRVAELNSRTQELARRADRPVDVQSAARRGLGIAIDRILGDGVIDPDEEKLVESLLGELNLTQQAAPDEWMRLIKALSLRDVLSGGSSAAETGSGPGGASRPRSPMTGSTRTVRSA